MNWPALWDDGWVISAHALTAMLAIGAGAAQLVLPKGDGSHRVLGYAWVALMAWVAGSSFWIHTFEIIGPFSPIHVLSAITLATLWYAVRSARKGRMAAHRSAMISLYMLALLLTGAFTLIPGRTMHAVFFVS